MQMVLQGLNPEEGPDFVAVYLDDVVVFSPTLEDHLVHLQKVIERLRGTGLKLKPTKCHCACKEVEFLGHLITPDGLMPNPKLVAAVQEFFTPDDLRTLRQFLGLTSYYRRFIAGYAAVARLLHQLTRKYAKFEWTPDCQRAVEELKQKLTTAPVLSYPALDQPFMLETDASTCGLGAVLSQRQGDGLLHPVAYASRTLSRPEATYSITEFETLAVVWAMTYFHYYLYGQHVTVYTDHSAVKAILETPNPSGKHARWWTCVYGSGVATVKIIHRSGKSNANADALSRSPLNSTLGWDLGQGEVQVSQVTAETISKTLETTQAPSRGEDSTFGDEQKRDTDLLEIITFLETAELPPDDKRARKVALQSPMFTMEEGVLYFIDAKQGHQKRVAVPQHKHCDLIDETH